MLNIINYIESGITNGMRAKNVCGAHKK